MYVLVIYSLISGFLFIEMPNELDCKYNVKNIKKHVQVSAFCVKDKWK